MRQKLIHILIIVGFGTTFYINSLDNFFVWNDWTLIVENPLIKNWGHLPEILKSAFWKPLVAEPGQIYRPLVSLSFMADFSLWGLKPRGYHLTNILLHLLNSVLIYFLIRLYVSPVKAFTAALLFTVHPIHTENVTYLSGRGELLMAFFLLGGTLLFLKSGKKKSWPFYLASLPLFFFALLAKETAAIFPLLLLSVDVTAFPSSWRSKPWAQSARLVSPFVVLGIYYLLRRFFVGMTLSAYSLAAPDFFDHLFLTLKAIPLYVGLLLFPWNLHFFHPLGLASPLDFLIWLSVLLLGGAGWVFRYAIRAGNWALAFALSWFFIGLLPLVYFIGFNIPLLEGWIYLPSLGVFLLVALALSRLQNLSPSRVHMWLTLLLTVVLGGLTFYRNRDWKDEMRIALHTVAASPDDPVTVRLMGDAYMRRARTINAEEMFKRGLALAPTDPRQYESMAWFLSFAGKASDALAHYHRILEMTPQDPYSYWLLGRYYRRSGQLTEAEKYFAQAVRLFPYSSELHNNLAYIYLRQGKLEKAHAQLQAALKILPHSPVLQANFKAVLQNKEN